jgi:RNA polymerase-binding transcription factor DksA
MCPRRRERRTQPAVTTRIGGRADPRALSAAVVPAVPSTVAVPPCHPSVAIPDLEFSMVRSRTVPARSKPRIPRRCDLLAARVPVLRAALVHQRDFRREQLAQLDVHEPNGMTSMPPAGRRAACDTAPAVREVQALVEAGARRALDDIELALARIRTGDYGRCRACVPTSPSPCSRRSPRPRCACAAIGRATTTKAGFELRTTRRPGPSAPRGVEGAHRGVSQVLSSTNARISSAHSAAWVSSKRCAPS